MAFWAQTGLHMLDTVSMMILSITVRYVLPSGLLFGAMLPSAIKQRSILMSVLKLSAMMSLIKMTFYKVSFCLMVVS